MLTYNHARSIEASIRSVFAQKFLGSIELVIGEDCSLDDTRSRIKRFCADAPIPVHLITSVRNVGMHANFRRVLSRCRGTYVAILEGDDRWVDPTKLEAQVNCMSADVSCTLCFTKALVEYTSEADQIYGPAGGSIPDLPGGPVSFDEFLWRTWLIPTASVMLRREAALPFPFGATNLPWIDGTLFLLLAARGNVRFIPRVTAVYCYGSGVSTGWDHHRFVLAELRMVRQLRGYLARPHKQMVWERIARRLQLAVEAGVQNVGGSYSERFSLAMLEAYLRAGSYRLFLANVLKQYFPTMWRMRWIIRRYRGRTSNPHAER